MRERGRQRCKRTETIIICVWCRWWFVFRSFGGYLSQFWLFMLCVQYMCSSSVVVIVLVVVVVLVHAFKGLFCPMLQFRLFSFFVLSNFARWPPKMRRYFSRRFSRKILYIYYVRVFTREHNRYTVEKICMHNE